MLKKDMIKEILKGSKKYTYNQLNALKADEVESIYKDLKSVNLEAPKAKAEEAPQISADIIAQIKAELRKELQAEFEEEKKSLNVAVETPKAIKKRVEIDRDALIPVMNVTRWKLVYVSVKSNAEWHWEELGDVEYIEYSEILTMKNSQRAFLSEPYVVILDNDVVENLGLTKMYEKFDVNMLTDSLNVFRMRQEDFEEMFESLPEGIQHSLLIKARDLHNLGKLDSVKKLRYLKENFKLDVEI